MSECPFDDKHLLELKAFVDICKKNADLVNHPKLAFFKDYLTSLGATIPSVPSFNPESFTSSKPAGKNEEYLKDDVSEEDDSDKESDVELNNEGVIEGDIIDDNQEMGDQTKEVTDDERDLSDKKRSEAMMAFSDQRFDDAIKLYTEAINLNPYSALLFAKRGQVYLKLNKPNACIKDCTKALELNCDSAAAYKFRGRANRLLGKWEESAHDLCESLKIDYDEQCNEWLLEVKPNAEKLRVHNLAKQRRQEEKLHRDKIKRARKAAAAHADAAKQAQNQPKDEPTDFASFLRDPDIQEAFADPEVAAALQDLTSNPANILKYQDNPKIKAVLQKLQTKFMKMGGFPAGFPGAGFPSGAGSFPGFNTPSGAATNDDVGLD